MENSLSFSRRKATLITGVSLAVIGSTAALSNSLLANFKLFNLTPFDLFDFISSNVLLPLGGLCLAIFAAYVLGYPRFKAALSNDGKLKNQAFVTVMYAALATVTPILVAIILLKGLKLF
jgi:NSS family neurotransmitter:Na+ symporter